MIRVRKIAHASYEMPDPGKQTEYYTDILGLNLIAKEKDAVYLANTVDHHSVVLRKSDQAKCTRIGFQIGPQEDLNEFEKQTQKHGVKTSRKKDPEPSISDMLVFEDPKGTTIEVFKRPDFLHQKFPTKGVVPHKLGHVAFHCEDVKKVAQFYIDVLGFRESDWMAEHPSTPPYPAYASNASAIGGACATVLSDVFGADVPLVVHWTQGDRSYDNFQAAAQEQANARIYGGIHFPAANEQGLDSGRKTGEYVARTLFVPIAAREAQSRTD